MRYLCVHCDKTFEHEDSAKKPRCPTCMRVHGVEPIADAKPSGKAASRARALPWVIAVAALAAAGVGYALWADSTPDSVGEEVPLAPLDRASTIGHLRREGVDARELADLLVPSEAVERWAERSVGDASGAQAKAAAILRAIRARAQRGAFEEWSFGVPRETPVATPTRLVEWLGRDAAHHHLYPIEVAALMASALRSQDVDAMVAEAIRFPDERKPADPTGQLGYFVVAVFDGDAGQGEPHYYDPYAGRRVAPEARVLNDLQAIGAALGHRALHLMSRESDPERAVEASTQALRLDARSPALRAVHGAILLVGGQPEQGVREIEAAMQLRSDAPRRNLLASVYLAPGPLHNLESASREIGAALEEYPDFAQAHATLAAIHLSQQDQDEARAELERAQRLDPDLHLLPQLWAGYYATTGNLDQAVSYAERAIERNPADAQARLMAARIYRQAGLYERMRREAHAVLERTPPARQAEWRQVIQYMLGPTALDPVDEEDVEPETEGEESETEVAEPGSLSLDSPLLGGSGGGLQLGGNNGTGLLGNERPSLLGNERPSLLGSEGGGLRLEGGGADE